MEIDRRLFLLSAAAAPLYAGPLVLLSADEAKVVEALCEQVVPADDAPGAAQAGVVFYIDKQLAGPLQRFVPAYRSGLARLRADCLKKTGKSFIDLPFGEQTAYLKHVSEPEAAAFFSMVVDHAMQGFYGSPAHSGNRDEASWKMLGIVDVMEGHKH